MKTLQWDSSEYLDSDEGIEEFLLAAFESEDPDHIARSLGVVAKARNMSQLAREIGMTRAALYKALSGEGNPEFATIMKVMKGLNISLSPRIKPPEEAA